MGLKGRCQGLVHMKETARHLPKGGRTAPAVFLHPGDYGKNAAGQWGVYPPATGMPGKPFVCGVLPEEYSVTEHQDGTITVHGPDFLTSLGPMRLVKGEWIQTDQKPTPLVPEPAFAAEAPAPKLADCPDGPPAEPEPAPEEPAPPREEVKAAA